LLIDLMSPLGGPTAALWVAIVLAILIDLSALKIGQRLASREFAALIAANPVTNHRIILYLRSFNSNPPVKTAFRAATLPAIVC
jgi:hypothetical protein